MSENFRQAFGDKKVTRKEMREWCQRPGRTDRTGAIQYFTEQAHKDICDINKIIRKYDKQGVISHVSKFEAKFGDLTGDDYKTMMDKVTSAQLMFGDLPSKIRDRFDNNPEKLLRFMEKAENRQEAIELGIIDPLWTADTDGLGEHVPEGGNVETPPAAAEPPPAA